MVFIHPDAVHADAGREDSHIFMWSADAAGGTIYILGSIHMLNKELYPLDKRIEQAYEKSKTVIFEADMDEAGSAFMQSKMLELGIYKNGQGLRRNVSTSTYESCEKRLKASGASMRQFDMMKPWLCAVTLVSREMKKLGFDPAMGIDAYYHKKALRDKKEILFFESARYQIELLADIMEPGQEELLVQSIEQMDVMGSMYSDILSAWQTGDAAKMESILRISLDGHPKICERLFAVRNRQWAEKILNISRLGDDIFVVAGAGHLVGDKGLIELLKRQGFALRQR